MGSDVFCSDLEQLWESVGDRQTEVEVGAGICMGRAGVSSVSIMPCWSLEVQSHVIRDAEIPSSNSGQTALSYHIGKIQC